MAKKSSVEKNNRRMRLVKRYAAKRAQLKAVTMNRTTPIEERFGAMIKLAKVTRNSAAGRVRLRCLLTGRPRGNYQKFKLCRMALRELASRGQIAGMVKASW